MKFKVNDGCIGCGLCSQICPNVFSMSDEGLAQAIDEEVDKDDLDLAEEAKDSCPVGVIEEIE